jgi:integrase
MPRRRDERARVLGPTWCKDKAAWRVTTVDPKGIGGASGRSYRYFGSEEDAGVWKEVTEARLVRLEGVTVEGALSMFETELRGRGNLESSVAQCKRWLELFFEPVMSMQIARLRHEKATELYARFREGRSVDYHRDALSRAKGFLSWCVERGWVSENVLVKVKGIGKRKTGKPQFTGDEAHRWFVFMLAKAQRRSTMRECQESDRATALLMLLLMALRQGDVINRRVRDVDLNATVLRVTKGKTAKSNRPRKIPDQLQPLLRQVVHGRDVEEWLFPASDTASGTHTNHWLRKSQRRFCKAAGVPYIPPHGLKGTAGSILAETGELSDKIADHLSHARSSMTERHYITPGIVDGAQAAKAFVVLSGGRR